VRPRTILDVARATRGRVLWRGVLPDPEAGAAPITGAAIDSREVRPGDLFVALPGDRGDGHEFLRDAFARGAAAAIVSGPRAARALEEGAGPLVAVEDPGRALLSLAGDERDALGATVVGVTGSSGKTCTKDLTAAVLTTRFRTVWSQASFNNEIGLPLTILAAAAETEAVVCEMGARGPGHIRLLCEVARPRIGVVTNVGLAHIGLFGSPEAIGEAKAELPEALPADGTAVLNADDPVVSSYASRTPARALRFGLGPDADVRAGSVKLQPGTGRARFTLVTPSGTAEVALTVPGQHMVANALAAAAVGHAMGLTPDGIAEGLAAAEVSGGRMDVFVAPGGFRVIDDAYNANPASMAAALRAARTVAGGGRLVAVLGEMAELGGIAAQEHARVGALVASLGVHRLLAVGEAAGTIADGALDAGLPSDRVERCGDAAAALRSVTARAREGDVVLVKASRVAGLDRLAAALRPPGERTTAGASGSPGPPNLEHTEANA